MIMRSAPKVMVLSEKRARIFTGFALARLAQLASLAQLACLAELAWRDGRPVSNVPAGHAAGAAA